MRIEFQELGGLLDVRPANRQHLQCNRQVSHFLWTTSPCHKTAKNRKEKNTLTIWRIVKNGAFIVAPLVQIILRNIGHITQYTTPRIKINYVLTQESITQNIVRAVMLSPAFIINSIKEKFIREKQHIAGYIEKNIVPEKKLIAQQKEGGQSFAKISQSDPLFDDNKSNYPPTAFLVQNNGQEFCACRNTIAIGVENKENLQWIM